VRKPITSPPLTVKELIKALSILDEDATIEFEYDGSDTFEFKTVGGFNITDDNKSIQLMEVIKRWHE
jgi:hypothetical protein